MNQPIAIHVPPEFLPYYEARAEMLAALEKLDADPDLNPMTVLGGLGALTACMATMNERVRAIQRQVQPTIAAGTASSGHVFLLAGVAAETAAYANNLEHITTQLMNPTPPGHHRG